MAYVSSNTGYNSGPITLVTGSAPAGATLVAHISGDSTQASTALPAGWFKQTHRLSSLGSTVSICTWIYPNWGGGAVSAAITSPPGDVAWSIHSYSGRDTSLTTWSTYATNEGNSATYTTPSATATSGADVYVSVAQEQTPGTPTVTTGGFVMRTTQASHVHGTADDENHAGGSVSCSGSPGANSGWVTTIVCLPASGGGGAPPSATPIRRRNPQLTYR
jgi:hypothetical protein